MINHQEKYRKEAGRNNEWNGQLRRTKREGAGERSAKRKGASRGREESEERTQKHTEERTLARGREGREEDKRRAWGVPGRKGECIRTNANGPLG